MGYDLIRLRGCPGFDWCDRGMGCRWSADLLTFGNLLTADTDSYALAA